MIAVLDLNTISIEHIAEEDFVCIKDRWNELLERNATNEVFLSWEWIYGWWDDFKGRDKEPINSILEDKEAALRCGIAGRKRVEDKLELGKMITRDEELFERIIL